MDHTGLYNTKSLHQGGKIPGFRHLQRIKHDALIIILMNKIISLLYFLELYIITNEGFYYKSRSSANKAPCISLTLILISPFSNPFNESPEPHNPDCLTVGLRFHLYSPTLCFNFWLNIRASCNKDAYLESYGAPPGFTLTLLLYSN